MSEKAMPSSPTNGGSTVCASSGAKEVSIPLNVRWQRSGWQFPDVPFAPTSHVPDVVAASPASEAMTPANLGDSPHTQTDVSGDPVHQRFAFQTPTLWVRVRLGSNLSASWRNIYADTAPYVRIAGEQCGVKVRLVLARPPDTGNQTPENAAECSIYSTCSALCTPWETLVLNDEGGSNLVAAQTTKGNKQTEAQRVQMVSDPLCQRVVSTIGRASSLTAKFSTNAWETATHISLCRSLVNRPFFGRKVLVDKLREYAFSTGTTTPFVLQGVVGSGKTALLAHVVEAIAIEPSVVLVQRIVGSSIASTASYSLLESLCRQIEDAAGIPSPSKSDPAVRVALRWCRHSGRVLERLCDAFDAASKKGLRLVVMIDQLERIEDTTSARVARLSQWLPLSLPEGVRVIVSVNEGSTVQCHISMRLGERRNNICAIQALPLFNRRDAVISWMNHIRAEQGLPMPPTADLETFVDALVAASGLSATLPLGCTLLAVGACALLVCAARETGDCNSDGKQACLPPFSFSDFVFSPPLMVAVSDDGPHRRIDASDWLQQTAKWTFESVINAYGSGLCRRSLGLITMAELGLTCDEIVDLIDGDTSAAADIAAVAALGQVDLLREVGPLDAQCSATMAWIALRAALGPLLSERFPTSVMQTAPCLYWTTSIVSQAARSCFLPKECDDIRAAAVLAKYFEATSSDAVVDVVTTANADTTPADMVGMDEDWSTNSSPHSFLQPYPNQQPNERQAIEYTSALASCCDWERLIDCLLDPATLGALLLPAARHRFLHLWRSVENGTNETASQTMCSAIDQWAASNESVHEAAAIADKLASAFGKGGRHGDAASIRRRVLIRLEHILPSDHTQLISTMMNTAISHGADGKFDQTLQLLRMALQRLRHAEDAVPQTDVAAAIYVYMGHAHSALGHTDDAMKSLAHVRTFVAKQAQEQEQSSNATLSSLRDIRMVENMFGWEAFYKGQTEESRQAFEASSLGGGDDKIMCVPDLLAKCGFALVMVESEQPGAALEAAKHAVASADVFYGIGTVFSGEAHGLLAEAALLSGNGPAALQAACNCEWMLLHWSGGCKGLCLRCIQDGVGADGSLSISASPKTPCDAYEQLMRTVSGQDSGSEPATPLASPEQDHVATPYERSHIGRFLPHERLTEAVAIVAASAALAAESNDSHSQPELPRKGSLSRNGSFSGSLSRRGSSAAATVPALPRGMRRYQAGRALVCTAHVLAASIHIVPDKVAIGESVPLDIAMFASRECVHSEMHETVLVRADICCERGLRLIECTQSSTHRSLCTPLSLLACIREARGDTASALRFFRRSATIGESGHGARSAMCEATQLALAAALWRAGDIERARPVLTKFIAVREARLGRQAQGALDALVLVSTLLLNIGRVADALVILKKCVEVDKLVLDEPVLPRVAVVSMLVDEQAGQRGAPDLNNSNNNDGIDGAGGHGADVDYNFAVTPKAKFDGRPILTFLSERVASMPPRPLSPKA